MVFLNVYRKNPQAYGITVVAFTQSIQGIIFPQGTEVFLLANSSKDNTRSKVGKGRDGFLWPLGLNTDKLYIYFLTSGTGAHLVCQAIPACSCMPYPDMGDYKGWTGLSPPATYPSPCSTRQTKVASSLDTTSMLLTTTLALYRVIRPYREPSTRVSTRGMDDEPTNK